MQFIVPSSPCQGFFLFVNKLGCLYPLLSTNAKDKFSLFELVMSVLENVNNIIIFTMNDIPNIYSLYVVYNCLVILFVKN